MESLTINPVSSVESIIVSEAAAILENGKIYFYNYNSARRGGRLSVVMEVLVVLATVQLLRIEILIATWYWCHGTGNHGNACQ